jgi:dipeptidase E
MKLLLTSSGIKNASIHDALVDLLGKPIAECDAFFVPTGIYPFPGGGHMAWRAISGNVSSPLCELGWKSLGLLELTALSSIDREAWVPALEAADALLVWGGDVLFLSYWMRQSGLTALLPSLLRKCVYVGVSAGSMVASATFAEACSSRPSGISASHPMEEMMLSTPQGDIRRYFVTDHGAGLVPFGLIPHFDNEDHPDASAVNAEIWASKIPVPVYAIDDQTAVKVSDAAVEVISEGRWKLFESRA